jgi:hypothetical protein
MIDQGADNIKDMINLGDSWNVSRGNDISRREYLASSQLSLFQSLPRM